MNGASIPHMRTAPKIVAEIKALDPGSEVTEHYIRQLVKAGTVPVVWVGNAGQGIPLEPEAPCLQGELPGPCEKNGLRNRRGPLRLELPA